MRQQRAGQPHRRQGADAQDEYGRLPEAAPGAGARRGNRRRSRASRHDIPLSARRPPGHSGAEILLSGVGLSQIAWCVSSRSGVG